MTLDSGAHSIYTDAHLRKKIPIESFVESDAFQQYLEDYVDFVKAHKDRFDFYVNLDIIGNPQLSWKIQKLMENTYHLNPLPVFHIGEDFKWFKRYMDNYQYIGISGYKKEISAQRYTTFADKVFSMICDFPDRLPHWRIHGFAMNNYFLLKRYPWYSADASSWAVLAAYGRVLLPYLTEDNPDYSNIFSVAFTRSSNRYSKAHFDRLSSLEQTRIKNYIEEQGFKLGKSKTSVVDSKYKLDRSKNEVSLCILPSGERLVETPVEEGVTNSYSIRIGVNLATIRKFMDALPIWPWPFKPVKEELGLGLWK